MNLPYAPPLPELALEVARLVPAEVPLYLVGGAVRDWLRNRPVHDLDLAVPPGRALPLGRQVAGALRAALVPLDKERGVARVVVQRPEGRFVLDFVDWRAPTLEEDLALRDFTVNALALDLHDPTRLIDPLGGLRDLRAGVLRACGPTAFTDDPLRVVRGVRLAAQLDFRIEPETRRAMRQAVALLPRTSAERQRDELFRILEGPGSVRSLQALAALGALAYLLPELDATRGVPQSPPHRNDVWTHTLHTLGYLNRLLEALAPQYDEDKSASFALGQAMLRIGRYRGALAEHLAQGVHSERSLVGLLRLAALYHDVGKPGTAKQDEDGRWRFFGHERLGARLAKERARALALSNAEVERLVCIVRHHLRPLQMTLSAQGPTRRAVYRFFRDTGPAGVEVALLSLADLQATYDHLLPQDLWARHLDTVRALWQAWWEEREEKVAPPLLLRGGEIIEQLGVSPGPQVGALLAALREAQALGEVRTREEALAWARAWLAGQRAPQTDAGAGEGAPGR